jgi:tetratricopeptide (TPR) repeat protein
VRVAPAGAADRAAATPRPDGDGKDRRDGDAPPKADAKPEKADAKPEKADAKPDTRSEKADAKPEKADPKPDKADGRRADARKKGDGPPTSEKEAKQLLAEAKNQVARMDYPGARDTYARIADSKFFRGQGLLGMAKVAWETRDVDGAITLAQQALKAGAGDPARTLLGHAYFKKNDYARALQYYEAVLANRPNDPEVKRSVEALRARMGGM